MGRRKQTLSESFIKTYKYRLSENTLKKYAEVVMLIEQNRLKIKSKSRYLQVRAVLEKCKKANIKINYELMEWNKRTNTTTKYITDRLIDDKKLTLILSNCPDTLKGRELHLAIRIGYYSGLRLSEILNLKTNDFNIDKNVRITTLGKGNKTVTAFLPVTFKSEVESFKELTINMTYVETTYSRILKRLGLISTFHSLRHSFATRLLKQGIAVQDVQKLLNHESIITTEKYLHVTFELKNDMEKLGY